MKYDFSPLFRSTVGFDRLIDMLDNSIRPDWPPYDIERVGADAYRISMAVAGFTQADIEITQQGNVLLVTSHKKPAASPRTGMLHQGLAFRNFKQTFNLADHVRVTAASLENGLLAIDLVREIPEQLKPRRIELQSPRAAAPAQEHQTVLQPSLPEERREAA